MLIFTRLKHIGEETAVHHQALDIAGASPGLRFASLNYRLLCSDLLSSPVFENTMYPVGTFFLLEVPAGVAAETGCSGSKLLLGVLDWESRPLLLWELTRFVNAVGATGNMVDLFGSFFDQS